MAWNWSTALLNTRTALYFSRYFFFSFLRCLYYFIMSYEYMCLYAFFPFLFTCHMSGPSISVVLSLYLPAANNRTHVHGLIQCPGFPSVGKK